MSEENKCKKGRDNTITLQKNLIIVQFPLYCTYCHKTLCCGTDFMCYCGNYESSQCSACDIFICAKCFKQH
jgi:hypothetical protein